MPKVILLLNDPNYLRQKYEVEELNASQVAKLIGCTSGAVGDALVRFGIPKRTMSQVLLKSPKRGSKRPHQKFKATLHNREWLQEHFWKLGLTASEISRLVGCSPRAAGQVIRKTFKLTSARQIEVKPVVHPLDIIQANRPLRPPMKIVEIEDAVRVGDEISRR